MEQIFNSLMLSKSYVSVNQAIIGTDNGLVPVRRQAIIWTNVSLFTYGPLE